MHHAVCCGWLYEVIAVIWSAPFESLAVQHNAILTDVNNVQLKKMSSTLPHLADAAVVTGKQKVIVWGKNQFLQRASDFH